MMHAIELASMSAKLCGMLYLIPRIKAIIYNKKYFFNNKKFVFAVGWVRTAVAMGLKASLRSAFSSNGRLCEDYKC